MSAVRSKFDVDLARDVRAVKAMLERFTPYIYEAELYGQLADNSLPKLTIGGLLMRLYRLNRLHDQNLLPQELAQPLSAANLKLAALREEWAVHYETKLLQEATSRLAALGRALLEAEETPRSARENYPSMMEKRVILEHLKDALDELGKWTPELNGMLASVDNRIRRIAEKSEAFIWDPLVEPAYPRQTFWFLYLLPPAR